MTTISVPHGTQLGEALRSIVPSKLRWLLAAVAIVALAVLAVTLGAARARAAAAYVTAPVAQQTLVQTVTASGTVNPQNDISVGTQVSGTIASIDVDYNSTVKAGQVLAKLDPSTFQAQLDQAQAALAQARAQEAQAAAGTNGAVAGVAVSAANAQAQHAAIAAAQANVAKAQAALTLAQTSQTRDTALLAQGYLAQSTVDTDRSNTAQDQADLASAQAAVAQAQAQETADAATVGQSGSTQQADAANAQAAAAGVQAAQAVVEQDELNLQHTVITSPVNGTVVARDISVGQTVAASLQTPTLFSIAQDLGKMEVDINVGEPDIGSVKAGETVNFSVLAYPNRTFRGTVSQVRINPQTLNNVVTYDVVVLVGNSDGALLPGMTANATIDVASATNALVVPLTALHSGAAAPATPWGATAAGASGGSALTDGSQATLQRDEDGKLVNVPVSVSIVTSTQAAIVPTTPSALAAGDPVVVATTAATAARSTARPAVAGGMSGGMRGMH